MTTLSQQSLPALSLSKENNRMKRIVSALSTLLLTASLAGTTAPVAAAAKKPPREVMYKAHCGMIYSAADAKKYHYICPMDHKPLVKITSGGKGKKGKR